NDRGVTWGVGVNPNIVTASFQAMVSALNRADSESLNS
ncbi:MAG: hypothetical protein ACI91O_000805, partial [Candidatus Poriferisodalaceae bacterium]